MTRILTVLVLVLPGMSCNVSLVFSAGWKARRILMRGCDSEKEHRREDEK